MTGRPEFAKETKKTLGNFKLLFSPLYPCSMMIQDLWWSWLPGLPAPQSSLLADTMGWLSSTATPLAPQWRWSTGRMVAMIVRDLANARHAVAANLGGVRQLQRQT
jgi:hypothetical protein